MVEISADAANGAGVRFDGLLCVCKWTQRNGPKTLAWSPGDYRFPRVGDILDTVRGRKPSYKLTVENVNPEAQSVDMVILGTDGKLTRPASSFRYVESTGRHPDIGFNLEYLTEWMDSIASAGNVVLEFDGGDGMIYCHATRQHTRVFEYVLMPMRIN